MERYNNRRMKVNESKPRYDEEPEPSDENNLEPFMGVKARRLASFHRDYRGDYLDVSSNPFLLKILDKQERMVTTRSQSQREKLGVSSSESSAIKKKTCHDWITNLFVMDKARDIWIQEIFREKQLKENPSLLGTDKFKYTARRQWNSVADSERVTFISKALDSFAPNAIIEGEIMSRKGVKKANKNTKQWRDTEAYYAINYFLRDYFDSYFNTHPDLRLTSELTNAAYRAWESMAKSEQDVYVAEFRQREDDRDEVFKYLQNDEYYKDLHSDLF